MTDPFAAARPVDTTRALLLALLAIIVLVAAVALRYQPPAPKPASASTEQFSSVRAKDVLTTVLGDQTPHPVGSPANAKVRERIVEQLRSLGYEPELQRGFSCDEWGDCGDVVNVVARLQGSETSAAVVLASHYDSVAAGPGASDDGAGVASLLEVARALRVRPQPLHSIILLVTDGEELGLLGARVFIDEHPWAKDVRAAVNLEARGTSGPSFLFETGSANAWAMRIYEGRVARPITNSIYFTAYKLLPNDTDFSVFKTRDWQGYNFAFTGGVQHYHTPLDNLANVSPASLQHHGDNALNTVLALANTRLLPDPTERDPVRTPPAETVYFDVFAAGILRWPVGIAVPIAIVVALLDSLAIAVLLRRRRSTLKASALGFVGVIVILAGSLGANLLLSLLLRNVGAVPTAMTRYQWIAQPLPLQIATAAMALLTLCLFSRLLARRAGFWGFWIATALLFNILSLITAALLPGLSFAFLLPATVMLLAAVPALTASGESTMTRGVAAVPGGVIAVALLLPTIWFLYPVLGVPVLPVVALLLALMLMPLTPLIAGAGRVFSRILIALSAVVVVSAIAVAAGKPVYDGDSPQRLNFEYRLDADAGKALWLASPDSGKLPDPIRKIVPFALNAAGLSPWNRGPVWSADAPKLELAAPRFEVLSTEETDGKLRYRARLTSERHASMASVCFAPNSGLANIVINGYHLPPAPPQLEARLSARRAGWRCLADHTLWDTNAVELQFDLASRQAAVELIVGDRSNGLPESGNALLRARPDDAIRSQDGDVTRVVSRIRLDNGSVKPADQ